MPTVPVQSNVGVSTGTIAAERIVVFRAPEIAQLDPIRRPLLALLDRLGLEDCPGPKFDWLEEDRMTASTLSGTILGVGTQTVNTALGSSSTIDVHEASIFKINHVFFNVTGTAAAGNTGQFAGLVTGVDETNDRITYTLLGAPSGTAIAPIALPGGTLADNEELVVIGSSYPEFSSRPVPMAVQPTNQFNYVQLFRDTWAASDYMQATGLYGEDEFARLGRRTVDRQMSDVEHALWYGIRHVNSVTATNYSSAAQPQWKTGGVFNFLFTNDTIADAILANLTYATYNTLVSPPMLYDPGNTFFGFSGADFMLRVVNPGFMGGAGSTSVPVTNEREMTSELFGLRIKRLMMAHGDVLLIPHYEVFRRREVHSALGGAVPVNRRQITQALINMDLVAGYTLSGHGIGEIEQNIESPGDSGRIDGSKSYVGLKLQNEARHGEYQFTAA